MGQDLTTLGAFLDALPKEDGVEMVFADGTGEIRPGYHLTEFRLARIAAIDCGRNREGWVEAQMQLLDGSGNDDGYMTVGRFHAIAGASIRALPGLEDGQLVVESGFGGTQLVKSWVGSVEPSGGKVHIGLTADHAQCRPAMAALEAADAGIGYGCGANATGLECCGTVAKAPACCGAAV